MAFLGLRDSTCFVATLELVPTRYRTFHKLVSGYKHKKQNLCILITHLPLDSRLIDSRKKIFETVPRDETG